jgi:hypothetical protein
MEDMAAGLHTQEILEPTVRKSPIQWPKKAAMAEEKHKGYLGELERLEGELQGTARELFGEQGLEARAGGELTEVDDLGEMSIEEMLWEIGGEDTGAMSGLSALEKLFSVLVIN